MKILYDASILSANFLKDGSRSGIFWTTYNILKEISKNKTFDIVLYISPEYKRMIPYIKKDEFLKRFTLFIDANDVIKVYQNKIKEHIRSLKNTHNLLKMALYFLKIIKNCIVLFENIIRDKKDKFDKNVDVFFSPVFAIPDTINKHDSIKKYLILYDIIQLKFPQYFSLPNSWFVKVMEALNEDTYYFCISESTKTDFLKLFPDRLDSNKMFVVPLAPSQRFAPNYDKKNLYHVLTKYGLISTHEKYIFSFCTLAPHKNLIFTITCFIKFIKRNNIHNLYFYLGGGKPGSIDTILESKINNMGDYHNKIIYLGYIDDEDVNTLYSNALFFTYISQYEGFGMPPLEAMQAGVPVITSNNSSLPEVVGEAAITIDYDNEDQCIKAFEDLYFNETLRNSYIEKGLERAKLFSWEKTVKIISDTICTAVEKRNNSY
jgi:glycosyltransferase involved in cell wall biosynthesis